MAQSQESGQQHVVVDDMGARIGGTFGSREEAWGERYKQAWVDAGVTPSTKEKIANSVFFGVMGRE